MFEFNFLLISNNIKMDFAQNNLQMQLKFNLGVISLIRILLWMDLKLQMIVPTHPQVIFFYCSCPMNLVKFLYLCITDLACYPARSETITSVNRVSQFVVCITIFGRQQLPFQQSRQSFRSQNPITMPVNIKESSFARFV